MIDIAPLWSFNAQAIDAAGDPHLTPGVHLRLIPSQRLGLPVMPFFVYRLNLGPEGKLGFPRTDITWVDSRGRTLTPPFDVTPDNPVTGWLPPPSSGICCWIQVEAKPAGGIGPVFPVPRPPRPPLPPRPSPNPARPPFPTRRRLQVDAVLGTPRGPAVVASATHPPYQLGASYIQRVLVTGRGRVRGAKWIDARRLDRQREPWRILALPLPGGARYAGIPNAEEEAKLRIERGAPLRFGLHDAPTAPAPADAPPATPADELNRVLTLIPEVTACLKRLIDDLSDSPWRLVQAANVLDQRGANVGRAQINCLGTVLHAALDPGGGRWLGFLEVDRDPPVNEQGHVVCYAIQGIWQLDREHLLELIPSLPGTSLVKKPSDLIKRVPKLPWLEDIPDRLEGSFLDLWTVACATIGNPPARPQPPKLGEPENGPWMPITPPDAEREIVIPASGMPPGAVVALARKQNSTVVGLNLRSDAGRALPLVPAVPDEATSTGTGEFADRKAPPEAVAYRAAQADWFGRWSGWTERGASAGVRPRPPRPTLNAFYVQPDVGDPMPLGPLSGTIQVRVPVPAPDALPPGARLLASLELIVDGAVTSVVLPTPASPPEELVTSVAGPAIERAGQRTVAILARWVDSAGVRSPDSEPVSLALFDPRPPEPVTVPNTLQYASRPDVAGNSRVELSWMTSPAQKRFRVFYADETRLVSRLEKMVARDEPGKARAQSILSAVAATTNAPDRAAVFVTNVDFFTRDMFEQLTGQPIASPGGSAPVRFEHAVSGSLRVLSFYRVVSVSEANVEGPFVTSPMTPVGVPNTGPPPQPFLNVEPLIDLAAPVPYRVRLTVRVPRGLVPAIEYRLRRSTAATRDVLQMPVVGTGSVPLPATDAPQEVEIIDEGGSEFDPGGTLKPWTTYHWRVEVRGGPEPGGGPTGQWSLPSAPASTMLLPPAPPAPATDVAAARIGDAVEIRWEHPDALLGGTLGGYHLDLYRQLPGEAERFLTSISADASPAAGGRDPDRTGQFRFLDEPEPGADPVPPGTSYRVVVMDPIGRASPPSAVAIV